MSDVSIADALRGKVPVGETVTVKGWVRTRRDSKGGFSFVAVNDGSCFDAHPGRRAEHAAELRDARSCTSPPAARSSPPARSCSRRARARRSRSRRREVKVVGWVDDPDTYPISPKQHTFEYLREVAHLRPRTNTFGAVTRVRHTLSMAIHRFFHEHGFFWIHTPIITTSDAEGAGADVPRQHARPRQPAAHAGGEGRLTRRTSSASRRSLTVSGQLNVETYCLAMSKVYTFGPTFRAENSHHAAAPGRVLDDRAGDRLRRPRRPTRTWPRRS